MNQPILLSTWPRKNTQRTQEVAMRLTQDELGEAQRDTRDPQKPWNNRKHFRILKTDL